MISKVGPDSSEKGIPCSSPESNHNFSAKLIKRELNTRAENTASNYLFHAHISKQAVNDVSLIRKPRLHYTRRTMFLPSKRKIPRNSTLTLTSVHTFDRFDVHL
jgi:hypothetical protein